MNDRPGIALIGSGNLAWHLAPALDNAGFPVICVYSRRREHAVRLQERLYGAEVAGSLDFSESPAELVLICVRDEAIEEVARELALPEGAVVAHTSGSQPLDLLRYTAAEDLGVFYPLQTFSKARKADFAGVPFLLEAATPRADELLHRMASALSRQVYQADSATRATLHLAAVMACNFSNHLMTIAGDLLRQQDITPDLLYPLMAETINKAMELGAAEAQTGPARRGDHEVIARHLQMLKGTGYEEVYALLSRHIREYYLDREQE